MRFAIRWGILSIAFACCAASAFAGGWDVACGTEGQPPCTVSKAKFEFKQIGLCAEGQFFDLIDGGTCWSCPKGYSRPFTVHAVNTDKACEKTASTDFRHAIEHGKGTGLLGTDCPGGQFWDSFDGKCHSCPSGYAMQVLERVDSGTKCAKTIPGSFARATKHGPPCGEGKLWDPRNSGECWSCPNGFERTSAAVTADNACANKGTLGIALFGCKGDLRSIRGTCRKAGECGKQGQRPCEIGERMPSCDDGLKEDFKQNICVAMRAGETPFTGGLSSLAGYWGGTVHAHCKELIGGIQINFEGDFGVGARCGKDVAAGFACSVVRDLAAGETDIVNSLMEKIPAVPALAEQMNTAANKSPCTELGERFAKATKHGKATGTVLQIECPAGQFWDPDGNCYSCPKDYTRTLFPVTHDRACTDKVGANLVKFGCGAFKGVEKNFDAPLDCTVEVLENGSLFDRPLDLSKANQIACMATGELGYALVKVGIETGKAVATGDISGIVSAIAKAAGTVPKAFDLKRLMECGKQK